MRIQFVAVLFAAPFFAACAHKAVRTAAAGKPAEALPSASSTDASEAIVRNDILHPVGDLKTVHFGFNSDVLAVEDREVLKGNAAWLKKNPSVKIQVAGYCDQRGTEEYNLALGQRRAKAVRDYLKLIGVKGNRVATISYGKEKPLCAEMTEQCWTQNRRAETLAAFPLPVASKNK
jgi:peptidoglycan-associated lipoprotein